VGHDAGATGSRRRSAGIALRRRLAWASTRWRPTTIGGKPLRNWATSKKRP
jgi:hypothetical protein